MPVDDLLEKARPKLTFYVGISESGDDHRELELPVKMIIDGCDNISFEIEDIPVMSDKFELIFGLKLSKFLKLMGEAYKNEAVYLEDDKDAS